MKRSVLIITAALSSLALSGCVDRQQADAKLDLGCQAVAMAVLPEGQTVEIKSAEHTPSTEAPGQRHVTLHAITKDGWAETETTYDCVFDEQFGFLSSSYTASFYSLKFNDQIYGQSGSEILGGPEVISKITDALRKVFY